MTVNVELRGLAVWHGSRALVSPLMARAAVSLPYAELPASATAEPLTACPFPPLPLVGLGSGSLLPFLALLTVSKISLMMSLINRDQLLAFTMGPAAFYFGSAVILTILAVEWLDSRLLWDAHESGNARFAD